MKNWLPVLGAIAVILVAGLVVYSAKKNGGNLPIAKPTPAATAEQLPADKQPKVGLTFSTDSHYVTVDITNLNASKLEYNLIYDATVGKSKLNTGVNSSANVDGKSEFTQRQLLGSESSGHFTYHENIANATMELTLRDSANRSVFTATYPFTVAAGQSATLTASQ